MALDVLSDVIATLGEIAFDFYIFSPRRSGKLRDTLSRAERIERIYDWRESTWRPHPTMNLGLLTLSPTVRPSS
jgi:hypothetical protein